MVPEVYVDPATQNEKIYSKKKNDLIVYNDLVAAVHLTSPKKKNK